MKKLAIIFSLLLLVACGGGNKKTVDEIIGSGDLKELKEKRGELVGAQKTISEELEKLEAAIDKLDNTKKVPLVTTLKVKSEVFNHYLELQGNIETKQNILLYPEFSGVLERVYVKKGQKVTKGQVLASINDGGLSQQYAQLKIQADLAKTTYERQKRLWEQKIGSEIQYLQAKTSYESQQKVVSQMGQQLAKTKIKAPFSGTIDDILTEQGMLASPGATPVIRLVNLDKMYVNAAVPERYLPAMSKNKKVLVQLPVLGKTIESKIRQVANYIDPNNRTFEIEVDVPNKDRVVKPNLTAKLQINDYTNERAVLIPQSIISENANGDQYVYVVGETNDKNIAKAKRVTIVTGKTQGDFIEVLEGVVEGNQIVSEGARSVQDGQDVQISKAN